MLKIASFFKKHYEYINLLVLTVLMIWSSVYYYAAFVLVGFIAVIACFYSTEKLATLVMAIYPMKMAILPGLFIFVSFFILLMMAKNFIIRLIKQKQEFSKKLILIIAIFLIYATCSHFFAKFTDTRFLIMLFVDILTLYFIYEARKEIDILKMVKVLCFMLIATGLTCQLGKGFNRFFRINQSYSYNNFLKLYGMTENPNIYGYGVVIAISALLALFFFEKINIVEFLLYFVPCFILGYFTISRNYLISVAAALAVFGVCYLVKKKIKALEILVPLCAIVCAIMLLFSGYTELYFDRGFVDYEFDSLDKLNQLTPEEYKLIFAGKMESNPGRLGIWKNYLLCILQSPLYVIFGVGSSAVQVGCIHAHNVYLYWFYRFGLVGLFLLGLIFYFMLKKDNVFSKQNKSLLWILFVFVVPSLVSWLFDTCDFVNVFLILAIMFFFKFKDWKNSEQKQIFQAHKIEMMNMLLKRPF